MTQAIESDAELRQCEAVGAGGEAMILFGLLRCLVGKHERSQGKVREIDGLNYSACKYCKVPMRQDSSRRWYTDRRGRSAAAARARSANN